MSRGKDDILNSLSTPPFSPDTPTQECQPTETAHDVDQPVPPKTPALPMNPIILIFYMTQGPFLLVLHYPSLGQRQYLWPEQDKKHYKLELTLQISKHVMTRTETVQKGGLFLQVNNNLLINP